MRVYAIHGQSTSPAFNPLAKNQMLNKVYSLGYRKVLQDQCQMEARWRRSDLRTLID